MSVPSRTHEPLSPDDLATQLMPHIPDDDLPLLTALLSLAKRNEAHCDLCYANAVQEGAAQATQHREA